MLNSEQIDIETIEYDQTEPSSLYLMAMAFKEVAIKKEDFYLVREQTWKQATVDEMLAMILASSIAENYEEGVAGLSVKSFQGLCNTVRFLYDFNHARFDGENYLFSPDKNIIAQLKKYIKNN